MQEPEREHSSGGARDEGGGGVPPGAEVLASGPPGRPSPSGRWRGGSRRGRAVVAAATVAVLGLGGTVAYAATSGGSGGGTAPAAPGSSSAPSPDRHGRGPWSGFGGNGVHGEATVKDPDSGDWIVRTWQRGTVEGTDGGRVTVKSEDGASWTWTVGKDTTVRREGGSATGAGALKKGDSVLVVGTRDGDTRTADRVLSGTFTERDDHGDHGEHGDKDGRHGHGPFGDRPGHRWGDDGTPSPAPSGSGAAT
ncbi:hypothetical protein [Streptomyces galbus]|uniref:DUF5666 domain-containing protein n=1 Tax=Streptomyces galbus TaxID=33898 RepID=A0A4U5X5A7_STRGB|nr:hypothetical protein [Streptomyces galbus]TKT09722.1 hypothetical protein E4U92_09040 [Streptomyces galbus]GHD32979.1 hypothetical protein GCM10010335_25540 [Streptomyces galbus]